MRNLLAILVCLFTLVTPAIADESPADFTFVNRGEVSTLDPNKMSWLQDIRIAYAIWEGLYALDPATLEPAPGAAERVDVSEDKKTWTFHLRPDGKWQNGDPVTSADFVFAWRRMLEEPADYTYLFHYIVGAESYESAFSSGEKPDFKAVGIEAIDERTLRVRLVSPVLFFPDLCAFPPFFPLHEKSMKAFRQEDGKTYRAEFTLPPNLVGNGPYQLTTWAFKQKLRLQASDQYWDRAHVKSRVIDMVSADEQLQAFLRYDSGAVDWLAEITGPIAADLKAKGRADFHVFPGFGTYFYSVNCQSTLPGGRDNPFKDARVRRAMTMAINKKVIVENITKLGEPIATSFVPTGIFPTYPAVTGIAYDVAGAKKLLADAGYPGGAGLPKFTILFNNEAHHKPVAEFVRRQWISVLGMQVELEGLEIQSFRPRLHNRDYDIARASWIGDYNDVSTFTDKYRSASLNNDSGWKNAEYDALTEQAVTETDAGRRLALLAKAEQILIDEAPIIPLYHYVNGYCFRDNVHGIPLHPRNMIMLKGVSVERK